MDAASHLTSSALAAHDSYDSARATAADRMAAVEPYFSACGRAGDLLDLPSHVLLHAGPPLSRRPLSPALLTAAVTAACREGFATDERAAQTMIKDGRITLRPAQDLNVVTSVDTVVGASSILACVTDRCDEQRRAYAPATPDTMPYEPGVDVPLGGALLEANAASMLSWITIAARKCVLRAAENIPKCTVVTALGTNGTAIGLQLSCLGQEWLSTDDLWLRFGYLQLYRVDQGILAAGDLLLRYALARNGRTLTSLDVADWLFGSTPAMAEVLRQIPARLFSRGLSRARPLHMSLFLPPH